MQLEQIELILETANGFVTSAEENANEGAGRAAILSQIDCGPYRPSYLLYGS